MPKIICITDDLHTAIDDWYKDYVFGIEDNGNIIENLTWPNNHLKVSHSQKEQLENIINNSEQKNNSISINNGYLFYSTPSQIVWAHFLYQTATKLYEYINNFNHYVLLVPKREYNSTHKEIFKIFNITNFILLEDDTVYNISSFNKGNYIDSVITNEFIWLIKNIRSYLQIPNNINPYRKIYIKRDNIITFDNDSNEIKKHKQQMDLRKILNENELIDRLVEQGFEIITFSSKTFEEKKEALLNVKIVISGMGANCINLFLSNFPQKLILFGHNRMNFLFDSYYMNIFKIINSDNTQYFWETSPVVNENECIKISSDPCARPYYVNINKILELISN